MGPVLFWERPNVGSMFHVHFAPVVRSANNIVVFSVVFSDIFFSGESLDVVYRSNVVCVKI